MASAVHYVSLLGTATVLAIVVWKSDIRFLDYLWLGLAVSAVTWVIAFFMRRSTRCHLCRGTPLVDSGARVHPLARRLVPFNHGVTAILSILMTQKFRCMYCGTRYDLLKSSHGAPERELRKDARKKKKVVRQAG